MQCQTCGSDNTSDRRFCAGCGAALTITCDDCGFSNQADARFCGGCGRALSGGADAAPAPAAAPSPPRPEERAPAAGERRQVTILFVDLAGFTELSGAIDAEELHGLISRFFEAADRLVEEYGGTVDKHLGDGLMALFGAPVAHGDDPLRAVRAAFDIHAAVAGLSAELGRELRVHAGIASGEVVAGGLGRDSQLEYTVLGESVNLASRLEALAEPGETLISEAVHRAVSAAVGCEPLGEVSVKGLDKPVRVWRARALAPGQAAGPRGAFVGRKSELRQFAGVLDACLESGVGQAVVVRGDAGIGKTRLVEEFMSLARSRGFAEHRGLVLDFGVGKGQDAIRSLVRSLLGLAAGSGEAERSAATDTAVAAGWLEPDQRVFLNDLLDLPQPLEMRALYDAMDNATRTRGKQDLVAALIRAASRRHPLFLSVEDVHWAEALTLAHLATMTATVQDCPAVLVMTSRIEGDPLDGAWRGAAGGAPLLTLDLGPLRQTEAMEMAGGLLDVNTQIVRDCIARSEGNPLFLEQLLRNAEESAAEVVPGSIQSLVQARMDRLPTADRQALQAASVIGQRFALDALRHLMEEPGYDCADLVRHYLVRPEGGDYLFAHALIREAVYSSLLRSRKRELHARAARWFADQDPVLHAEHLDRAEEPAAANAYHEAAKTLAGQYHYERAIGLLDRGLEIAEAAGDRFALTCLKGEMLHDLGAIAESTAVCRRALELATNEAERSRAWFALAAGMRVSDDLDEAFEALEVAEELARKQGLTAELARIYHLRGNLCFPLGRMDDCLAAHEMSLEYARRTGSPQAEAEALGGMGDAVYAMGRMASAHKYFLRCVELCRRHGFGRIEVANFPMVAHTLLFLEGPARALPEGVRAVEAAARASHHRAELNAELSVLFALVELDRRDEARQHLERGRILVEQLGARRFGATPLGWEALIRHAEGRASEATRLAERALQTCYDTVIGFDGPRTIAILAMVTRDPAERRRLLEQGERLLAEGSVGHNHLMFYRHAIDAMLAEQDWDRAEHYAGLLEDFTRTEPLLWSEFFAVRARALAAFGRGRREPELCAELERLRDRAHGLGWRSAVPALELALGQVGPPASVNLP